jgi:hypothetical protein
MLIKDVNIPLKNISNVSTSSWRTDLEIVINHNCSVVSNYISILTESDMEEQLVLFFLNT